MDSFESLDVWKKSAGLGAEICLEFKDSRDFGYKDQIKRAGLSISSNIAEGFERSSYRQFGYFLKIARGSPGEVRSQIYIGIKTGATEKEKGLKWVNECKEVSSMLHSLIEPTKRIAEKNI
jgi:four helix bundle protein